MISFPFCIRSSWVAGIALAMAGCGSIEKNHRTGPREQDRDFKLPGGQLLKMFARSSLGATVKAPLASTRTGLVMLKDRTYTVVHGTVPQVRLRNGKSSQLPAQAGGPEFESFLDRQGLRTMTTGTVKFGVDGDAFFPELLREIELAEKSVDIQTYIFDNDRFAVRIADALKKKANEVPVRVYFDALGSEVAGAKPPEDEGENAADGPVMHRYLQQNSQVKVRRFFNPWLVADHTKLHLIDGRIAYVGGMNIGQEYVSDWHDLMARIEGPVVEDLVDLFESRWRRESMIRNWGLGWLARRDRTQVWKGDRDASQDVPLRVLITDTSLGKRDVLKATLIAIRSAQRRVWIQTPYFSGDEITAELLHAVRRGVDVRVVIPGENDTGIMEAVNFSSLEGLVEAGGKVFLYPGMTHLKATVCDDWATFGSSNYDTLSLRINRELNLASSHPAVVEGMVHNVFRPDFRKSRILSLKEIKTQSAGPVVEFVGDQL